MYSISSVSSCQHLHNWLRCVFRCDAKQKRTTDKTVDNIYVFVQNEHCSQSKAEDREWREALMNAVKTGVYFRAGEEPIAQYAPRLRLLQIAADSVDALKALFGTINPDHIICAVILLDQKSPSIQALLAPVDTIPRPKPRIIILPDEYAGCYQDFTEEDNALFEQLDVL